jgi:NAD(P)-dependent dehydrogenase (short-subunit alcohol dehydrogenase family)
LFLLISLPFFVIKEVILKVNAIIYDKSNPNHLSQDHAELVVVVTGCDTGFGNDLVLKLLKSPPPPCPGSSSSSVTVFALCYSEAGCERVSLQSLGLDAYGINAVHPVQCDVTSERSVAGAFAAVAAYISRPKEEGSKCFLHSVINNAGVGTPGYVDMIPVKKESGKVCSFERDMEVNYFGALRVVKAALPLIKDQATAATSSARYTGTCVVNVTSMAGLVSSPNMGAYTGSKHAMEAVSTCLSYELKPWGCNVTTVNPSFHRTPLVEGIEGFVDVMYRESEVARRDYGKDFCTELKRKSITGSKLAEWRAENVSGCIYDQIYHRRSGQLLVGMDARFAIAVIRHLPASFQRAMVAGWKGAQFYIGVQPNLCKNKLS